MEDSGFPSTKRLQQGAWLATIAYAIYLAENPQAENELSWDGPNYSRQDSEGTRGTVTFSESSVVGVFRDETSSRLSILASGTKSYDITSYLKGMPEQLRKLADAEALQFVLDDFHGKVQPVITAAFWSESYTDRLKATENWEEVLRHGAHLLRRELLEPSVAIAKWQEYFGFTEHERQVIMEIYRRKTSAGTSPLVINKSDIPLFMLTYPSGQDLLNKTLKKISITLI